MKKKKKAIKMSAADTAEFIKQQLGYKTLIKPPEFWLDTGSPYANKVFGSKRYGIAYGKIILIAGPPSSGKSVIAAKIMGLAQEDGAEAAWVDGENSWDAKHVSRQGVKSDEVALFQPEYGEFKYKSKKKRNKLVNEDVEAAEDVFTRVETWLKLRRKLNPEGKRIVVVDSTTAFAPEEELMAGLDEQNMRTKVSPAVFWNMLSKHWVPLALHCNAIIIFISQLRTNPGKMFGNPEYVTGGNGLQYYASVVVWQRRISDGAIIRNGKQVGIRGILSNKKNKAGKGSVERKKCGYEVYLRNPKWKFMDVAKVKKNKKGEKANE